MTVWEDAYTDEPTHIRIFSDGAEYFVDGADDDGNYTEQCWSFDTHAEALANVKDFIFETTQRNVKWKWRVSNNLRHDQSETSTSERQSHEWGPWGPEGRQGH